MTDTNTAPWFTPEFQKMVGVTRWAEGLRPLLREIGPETCAVFVLFDSRAAMGAFPWPEVTSEEHRSIFGFIPFGDEGGLAPYDFDPKTHVTKLIAGDYQATMYGLVGASRHVLEGFIDGFTQRARRRLDEDAKGLGEMISGLRLIFIGATASS